MMDENKECDQKRIKSEETEELGGKVTLRKYSQY